MLDTCGLALSHGLVLYIGITSCTFPPWTELSKKNDYDYDYADVIVTFLLICIRLCV